MRIQISVRCINLPTFLDEHGIAFVMTSDTDRARLHWISKFPALAYYRNGDYIKFPGDVSNAKTVLRWLTSEKVINVPGKILEVNSLMLAKMIQRQEDIFVFFYEGKSDILGTKILRGLEDLEDQVSESFSYKILNLLKNCTFLRNI